MKRILLVAVFLLTSLFTIAQRLPYPVIFVHGWVGSDKTWYAMGDMFRSLGINVNLDDINRRGGEGSQINFHLNADGNDKTSYLNRSGGPYNYGDIHDYNSYINPNNDVFFVNFDNPYSNTDLPSYSNQAAAVKQGFSIGLAIKKVINATKAKKVILVGHSMGGLAIREYLQNPSNWLLGDGQHHVAKLVTIGTPHGGSNANSGNLLFFLSTNSGNELSEAVRDLRYPAPYTSSGADRGVYLFGGFEYNINRLGLFNYFNTNVDCDDKLGYVQGLNQKSIYTDLAYACVVGLGGNFIFTATGSSGDDVVEGNRASIFDMPQNVIRYNNLSGDTFYAYESNKESSAAQYYSSTDYTWHTKLTKQRFTNMAAIDEPSNGTTAYGIDLNKGYTGFLTKRPDGTRFDSDLFKIFVDKPGVLTVNLSAEVAAGAQVVLYDQNWFGSALAADKSEVKLNIPRQGTYFVEIKGNNWTGSEVKKYTFSTSFCPLDLPFFSISGSPTFCQGKEIILSAESYYDTYRWYKDGQQIPSNSPQLTVTQNQLTVNQTGRYTLEAYKCGVWLKPDNGVIVTVKPLPTKPTITKEEQPDKFILTSSGSDGNQWFLNGKQLSGATSKTYIPQELGAYTVAVTQSDCSSSSEAVVVKMDKPLITYNGPTSFFEGDSLVLSGAAGFSQYHWTFDEKALPMVQSNIAAKKSGSYRLATQRGVFKSEFSDPVAVTAIPVLGLDPRTTILKVFPNPNNGTFSLELPEESRDWQIQIIDAQGKQIIHQKQGKQIQVKTPAGTYFLRVSDAKVQQTVKFELH